MSVPLAAAPVDLVNNAGSIVFDDGYGADRAYLEPVGPDVAAERDVFAFTGGAVLLRPDFLEAVELLDKRFFLYYEDTDLSWRGIAQGWRYRFVPGSIVRHRHSAIVGEGSPPGGVLQRAQPPDDAHQERPGAARRPRDGGVRRLDRVDGRRGRCRVARRRGRPMTADRTDLRASLHARSLVGSPRRPPSSPVAAVTCAASRPSDDRAIVDRLVPHAPGVTSVRPRPSRRWRGEPRGADQAILRGPARHRQAGGAADRPMTATTPANRPRRNDPTGPRLPRRHDRPREQAGEEEEKGAPIHSRPVPALPFPDCFIIGTWRASAWP